jgi:hypothetical protein
MDENKILNSKKNEFDKVKEISSTRMKQPYFTVVDNNHPPANFDSCHGRNLKNQATRATSASGNVSGREFLNHPYRDSHNRLKSSKFLADRSSLACPAATFTGEPEGRRPAPLWTPLFWSILPYLLTKCFGYEQVWTEMAHLLLSLFWLYLALKFPWDFYLYLKKKLVLNQHHAAPPASFYGIWLQRCLFGLAIVFIFSAPSLMLYLIEKFHLDTSAATTAAASAPRNAPPLRIINPQVFFVITLINPIRYFFWNQSSEEHGARISRFARLPPDTNRVVPLKSIEGGHPQSASATSWKSLEAKYSELQLAYATLHQEVTRLQQEFSLSKAHTTCHFANLANLPHSSDRPSNAWWHFPASCLYTLVFSPWLYFFHRLRGFLQACILPPSSRKIFPN